MVIGLLSPAVWAAPGTSDDANDSVRSKIRQISKELSVADRSLSDVSGKISQLDTTVKTLEAIWRETRDPKLVYDGLFAARTDAANFQEEVIRIDSVVHRLHSELARIPVRDTDEASQVRDLMRRVDSSMRLTASTGRDLQSVQVRIADLFKALSPRG
jgi:hypothetical protein